MAALANALAGPAGRERLINQIALIDQTSLM